MWTDWPEEYRDPDSPAVEEFARDNRARVLFFKFLQWQLDLQIAEAQAHAPSAGHADRPVSRPGAGHRPLRRGPVGPSRVLRRGLPRGRASGRLRSQRPGLGLSAAQSRGAPGQWLPAVRAVDSQQRAARRRAAHRSRDALLPAVLDAGRARPRPRAPTSAITPTICLGVLALESVATASSWSARIWARSAETCGTGWRKRASWAIACCGSRGTATEAFARRGEYSAQAAVSTTTHDLPTLAGFFTGRDIEARRAAGLIDERGYHASNGIRASARNRTSESSAGRRGISRRSPGLRAVHALCSLGSDQSGGPDRRNRSAEPSGEHLAVSQLAAQNEGARGRARKAGRWPAPAHRAQRAQTERVASPTCLRRTIPRARAYRLQASPPGH